MTDLTAIPDPDYLAPVLIWFGPVPGDLTQSDVRDEPRWVKAIDAACAPVVEHAVKLAAEVAELRGVMLMMNSDPTWERLEKAEAEVARLSDPKVMIRTEDANRVLAEERAWAKRGMDISNDALTVAKEALTHCSHGEPPWNLIARDALAQINNLEGK